MNGHKFKNDPIRPKVGPVVIHKEIYKQAFNVTPADSQIPWSHEDFGADALYGDKWNVGNGKRDERWW